MALCLLMITAGISVDLMRAFVTVHQLEFGAQTAALYALSLSTNKDGSYSLVQAQTNVQTAVAKAGAQQWNVAQVGPLNGVWSSPVTLSQTQFVLNPLDQNEFFLQVTAQCAGQNALKPFFIPLAYAGFSGVVPPAVQTESFSKTVEVLGQPATRIGAGAPVNSAAGQRAADFVGFACLPLAISNLQFSRAAKLGATVASYTVDLVSSSSAEYLVAPPAGHIKGCLVNLVGNAGALNYYAPANSLAAVGQLQGLLGYFTRAPGAVPPSMVETGSQLNGFDPAALGRSLNGALRLLALLPANGYYIVPVLQNDPSFAAPNKVVGFARLQLAITQPKAGLLITATLADSVPLRNASSATGFSGIPGNAAQILPAPVPPFTPRTFDQNTKGVSVRPPGIVLAPAISPRQIALPILPTT
jgi:hypothetical protein